jgi:predicted DNA-binding protein (MmcQ/YjbR family)
MQAGHMARRQWINITQRNKLKPKEWEHYILQSYELVKQKLTKKLRKELGIEDC